MSQTADQPTCPATTARRTWRLLWLLLILPVLVFGGRCGLRQYQYSREAPGIEARLTVLREALARGDRAVVLSFVRQPPGRVSSETSFAGQEPGASDRHPPWETLLHPERGRQTKLTVYACGRRAAIYIGDGFMGSGEEFELFKADDGQWYFTGEWRLFLD